MTRANDLLLGKGENGPWSRSNSVTHAEEEIQMEAGRVKQRRHCRQTDEARCRFAIRFRRSGLAYPGKHISSDSSLFAFSLSLSLSSEFITDLIRKVREGRAASFPARLPPGVEVVVHRNWCNLTTKVVTFATTSL